MGDYILRRVSMLRRMLAKHPFLHETASDLIQLYQGTVFPGSIVDDLDHSNLAFAPQPGTPQRKDCKAKHHA